MGKLPCRKITGEVFVHESEEYDKVAKAFSLFFSMKPMKEDTVPGSFGTGIRIIRAELNKKHAQELLKKIIEALSAADRRKILNELKLRLDENGGLYLRFDKQAAYEETIVLTGEEEDSIQVIIMLEAFPANIANFANAAKTAFE
jgi:RNA binding exosome subunit